MREERKPTDIGILAYPGAQQSAVLGLTDLFQTANRISLERRPESAAPLCVSHWRPVSDGNDIERSLASDGSSDGQLDALVVPPCLEDGGPGDPGPLVLDWIRNQHKGGAVICSICAGAFVVAEAGLLRGRPATTHWAFKDRFEAQFPDVKLEIDKLIVEDGDIVTAGGVMAWVDLGLRLVDRFIGPSVMLEVARFFLVDPSGREQRFYTAFAPQLHHGDESILKTQHWLQTNCNKPVTLATMSSVAGLSERTFLRRFRKATKLNPTAYVQMLRVGKARELLEASSLPFNQVAWKIGYEDPGAFRKVFQKVTGLSPGDYRRRFAIR